MPGHQSDAAVTFSKTGFNISKGVRISLESLFELEISKYTSPLRVRGPALCLSNLGDVGDKNMVSHLELLFQREQDA